MSENFHRFDIAKVTLADLELANDIYLQTQIAQNTDLGVPMEARDSEWFVNHQFRRGILQGLECAFGQSLRVPENQERMSNDKESPKVGNMLQMSENLTPMQKNIKEIMEEAKTSIEKEQREKENDTSEEALATEENGKEESESSGQ